MGRHPAVPEAEIAGRIRRFQQLLVEHGVEVVLLRQNADIFYFSGTVQDGHLLIPAQGDPLFLVWRVYERAVAESPLEQIEHLPSLSRLPDILDGHGLGTPGSLGLELDVLPANLYLYYTQRVWPEVPVTDVTHLVRLVRAEKSPWEVDRIREASRQIADTVALVPEMLRAGMSEIELASEIESALRRSGHPGYIRVRGWNQEMGSGQILTGPPGAYPSWINAPGGGQGTSVAYGQNAGFRRIEPGEPVSIDLGGSLNGYLSDQTRLFCVEGLPPDLESAYRAVLALHRAVAARLVPGAVCSEVYEWAVSQMEEQGYGRHFMGFERNRVNFIGHGLGVEIDEYPFLARKNPMSLVPGMVVAVEPKLAFPERGLIGIEDTYLITKTGAERLTMSPQELGVC
jgi:Xaa-Pro aminopeptidase